MASGNLVRWSGFAGIVGGLLWIVLVPLTGYAWSHPVFRLTYEDYNRIMPIPLLLILASLVGFYIRQEGCSGRLGLAGFSLGLVGLTLMLAGGVVEFWLGGGGRHGNKTLSYAGWHMVIAGVPTFYLGLILLGTGTIRARVLSGWRRAAPLIIALLLPMTVVVDFGLRWGLGLKGPLVSVTSFGLGWVLLGYALYRDTKQSAVGRGLRIQGQDRSHNDIIFTRPVFQRRQPPPTIFRLSPIPFHSLGWRSA